MIKRPVLTVLMSLGLTFGFSLTSHAETVLERAARTGTLTVGTLTEAVPLSYVNDKGQLVGYSVDLVNLIKARVEEQLGRPIQIDFVTITPEDGMAKMESQEIDLACNVGFTWNRDLFVDFSVPLARSGTTLLLKAGSGLGSPESLQGKRIGVLPKTIAEQVIKLVQPNATFVPISTLEEGFKAVNSGSIDALASDMIALEGYRQTVSQPNAFMTTVNQPYNREGIACIVPENNSKFLDIVNYSIIRLMQGYLDGEASSVELVNRWFGPQGIITVDPKLIQDYFTEVVNSREQIRISK
ncbi:extracellular substrate binding-like orphan protein GrrP [Planktothrix mougeotii]|uniref:Extracellular substrate binding-like orphan protein GrrP n=1 Tax=Planktothrix mougeotii LEGE 06226 TaxID=1828728 RepID=A0ABR9U9Q4_9CYAN|nr:extracellular substrate binding-like orphan protein GrrP [Planktothrix mougeotii]MBE9143183.1 extracellular substrate binding-like orphan protein GrrP [Planktothrix mougeotii LEGE 06226]